MQLVRRSRRRREVNDFSVFSGRRWNPDARVPPRGLAGGSDRRRSDKNATGNDGHYARDRYAAWRAGTVRRLCDDR